MNINFPKKSTFDLQHRTVLFPFVVDGHEGTAAISLEALQDHFGAPAGTQADRTAFLKPFEENRPHIEELAEKLIGMGARGDVLLKSEYF